MYQIDDIVAHPSAGVCRVTEIRTEHFPGMDPEQYYILKPLYDIGRTTIYTPVNSDKIHLRKLLSEDDIRALIHSVSTREPLWIDNDLMRKEAFSQILRESDPAKIIQLIIELHKQREAKQATGKRLHSVDERFLEEAENLFHQEVACTMKLKVDEVAPFIMKELQIEKAV